jgi:hypothetical protein
LFRIAWISRGVPQLVGLLGGFAVIAISSSVVIGVTCQQPVANRAGFVLAALLFVLLVGLIFWFYF